MAANSAFEHTATVNDHFPAAILPQTTTGQSRHYIIQCAMTAARASAEDPLTVAFQREKSVTLINATSDVIREVLYKVNIGRLATLMAHGSVIAEAGDFAVVACWSPPDPSSSPPTESDIRDITNSGRMCFATYLIKTEDAKMKFLYPRYGNRYWHLSLMGRDPTRAHVSGAVRAVVVPFVKKAKEAKLPIWLCAGSDHARDVYAHFGFRVVESLLIGDLPVHAMILEPTDPPIRVPEDG